MESQSSKTEIMVGEPGYVNKNCWLARNLGYPPSRRCRYCELKFSDCLFEQYLVITLILLGTLLALSYLIEQNISKSLIISLFVLIISYGYFFNRSTEKIIVANFEEKKAKNAFRDLSETLQQKVDEQTKEIRQQKEKVEKAYEIEKHAHEELKELDEAKTNFMLITQHHLRTPLSVNKGFLDLLLSGKYGRIPKKIKGAILELSASTEKEIETVNELLDVSSYQLGHGYALMKPGVPVKNILAALINDLKPLAENNKIYLNFESRGSIPNIVADERQLKMALQNIIDNAIKYTKKGGVFVKIEAGADKIKILVKDTGIGMDKAHKKRLFEKPFQRSKEAWTENAVGKGIGLYLSAQIIKTHGGNIWAESEGPGKGSAFYIELPLALP